MTALGIVALSIFIFGAYAYASVVVLALRHRTPVWSPHDGASTADRAVPIQSLAMFVVCTLWFVFHSIIVFRSLMGDSMTNDLIDMAALELVFIFPGLIFHTVLTENGADGEGRTRRPGPVWGTILRLLYAVGVALAIYFPAVIYGVIAGPRSLSPIIGLSAGLLFTIMSVCSLVVMASRPHTKATSDERRLRRWMMFLFGLMIVLFLILTFMRDRRILIEFMDLAVRTTPLIFLLVSVYFENRFEFYDLIIKRGVILVLSLLLLATTLAISLQWIQSLPEGITRAWLFAVVLLPVAMLMPWLHSRVGRLLDRLWFGREFTPIDAVKHVLGAMQQATDESSLIAATESTLSEMFRRRVQILLHERQTVEPGGFMTEIPLPGSDRAIRMAIVNAPGQRQLLSEDLALLRSLGGVFGFMLENVRLQQRRQEQDHLAQELRLQSSRSELKALRAQINPHFLFNALNAIASLIHSDPARADAAVEQLAEVFRYTLRRSDQEWAPLDQELTFAKAYLDVEQARFGRRLAFAIDADPALGRAQVPSMLLQTLVENAVKHGISRQRAPGRIDIRASRHDGELVLEVRDTGPGPGTPADRPTTGGESFGLRSVRDRLLGHFGAQASLELVREGDVTVARIRLPHIEQPFHAAGAAAR